MYSLRELAGRSRKRKPSFSLNRKTWFFKIEKFGFSNKKTWFFKFEKLGFSNYTNLKTGLFKNEKPGISKQNNQVFQI